MGNGPSRPPPAVPPATASGSGQAQPQGPYKFDEITAKEKKVVDPSELRHKVLNGGALLDGKTKKYWVDSKDHNCFMLYPRGLYIAWSEEPKYWSWYTIKDSTGGSDADVEAIALQNVCWLEVQGTVEASHLNPGVLYEVFFEVMVEEPAYGWAVPVNLRLKVPGKNQDQQQHKEKLQEKERGKWMELKVGEFELQKESKGEIEISLYECEGAHWKRGLNIKSVIIRPKVMI